QATDPDGDRVNFALAPGPALPNGVLDGTGKLSFTPAPDQVGTYQFGVSASDGQLTVTQTVTLNVVADLVTTTRLSGVLLNTSQQPLAGVPVSVGTVQSTTAADGSFLLDFGIDPVPADTLKVVPS